MTNEIIEKLKKYASAELKEEAHIVYIMVQLGKIIERDSIQNQFPVLCFYRDWVVHHQLDRMKNDNRRTMYDKLNDAVTLVSQNGKNDEECIEVMRNIAKAISFRELKREIESLFIQYTVLDTTLDNNWFKQFINLLINILTDIPLKPTSGYQFEEFQHQKSQDREAGQDEYEIKIKLRPGISCNEMSMGMVVIDGFKYTVKFIS